MSKKMFCIACAVTIVLTVGAAVLGMYFHTGRLAAARVSKQTEAVEESNAALTVRRDILKDDVGSMTDDTSRREELNKQIAEITGQISEVNSDIKKTEKETAELESREWSLNNTLEKLRKGMNLSEGRSIVMGLDELMCPEDIAPGRYIATGDGLIRIIADSGSARAAEDLLMIETNSYTFDLSSGESVIADGEVTLTELK